MTETEVEILLAEAPEFLERYLALVEAVDGNPGAAATFVELAGYVVGLVDGIERFRPSLVRCLAALERVAESSEDAEDFVVWSFFDELSPDHIRRLDRWIGPHTRALVDAADRTPP
jgi:hypothetical protein